MDVPDWIRYTVYVLGIVLTGVCVWLVRRSARRLDKRIEEFHAELDARQGAPLDPYAALAEIYAEEAARDAERKRGKANRKR